MAGMTDARAQVATDLRAVGLTVKDHVPEKVVPPLVVMGARDPMLEPAETMSGLDFKFNLNLLILIPMKPNSEALAQLEAFVEKVLYNLGDWDLEDVEPIVYMKLNDNLYPSVEVRISKTITIEGGI